MTKKIITMRVALNGTQENPYHKLGLTQNPFPQIAKHEWVGAERRLQSLGGDPIPNTDHIRKVLLGFSPEFIELCCSQFKPGLYVTFDVEFPVGE